MTPPAQRRAPTYPSLKYGPTADYGNCELSVCGSNARATCPECDGHFCRDHVAHAGHAGAAHAF